MLATLFAQVTLRNAVMVRYRDTRVNTREDALHSGAAAGIVGVRLPDGVLCPDRANQHYRSQHRTKAPIGSPLLLRRVQAGKTGTSGSSAD